MPNTSRSSAGATYLDRTARIAEVRAAARRAHQRVAGIRRIILFGSLASGIPTPRSDADLLIVLADSPHRRWRDRIPEMLTALSPLPCPVDLHVLTEDEMRRLQAEGSSFVQEVLAKGLDLLADDAGWQSVDGRSQTGDR